MKNFVSATQDQSKGISTLIVFLFLIFISSSLTAEGTLFVGLEGSAPPTFHSDMTGFPNVTWTSGFSFDVSGAAATPDGTIYLCEGAFTTHLYQATLTSAPQLLCTIANDMSALAYGNGTLYGFSNYADPKGIYSIDTTTGASTLVLDVYTGYSFRFFALDFNPVDGLFYGYTEYGASGLYSINIDTGEIIQLTGSIPATNGQGRGLAVGDNTVYLTATRGDDGIPFFAYDISQGVGGSWVEFPNPYPAYHSTGGAAWIPAPIPTIQINGRVIGSDEPFGLEDCDVILSGDVSYQTQTDLNGYFLLEEVLANADYALEISLEGYETYNSNIQAGEDDIDLGTIVLDELVYPAEDVLAVVNEINTEVTLTWNSPSPEARDLESYDVYRLLEVNNGNPFLWDLIADDIEETTFVDTDWILLEPEMYQYAVVAIYTGGLEAEVTLSNVLEKILFFYPPTNLYIDANATDDFVTFSWDAPAANDLIGFNVYLDGVLLGNTIETVWIIYGLINGQQYAAGVEAVYDEGVSELVEIDFEYMGLGAGNQLAPAITFLNNYPNPFNPTTKISFSTTENVENAEIVIYNLKGQKVKQLFSDQLSAGHHTVIWNGTDDTGKSVASGVYFYKMKAGKFVATKKMILMK
ncbi:MAG: T9SS type A sorting domain-containing protein [Candidatus Cloacimonadales bacterium]|nr:T9SS type A sorting domain-containing protein [Candidatus Cloacimonadales bacterium]